MADVVTLGVEIVTTGAEPAKRALAGLEQTTEAAEEATKRLSQATTTLNSQLSQGDKSARAMAAAKQLLHGTITQTETATQQLEKTTGSFNEQLARGEQQARATAAAEKEMGAEMARRAGQQKEDIARTALSAAGYGRLRTALAGVAQEALGLHPALARVALVIGSFMASGPQMAGALLGIAALGFAWKKVTADAREAREEHERLLQSLKSFGASEQERIRSSTIPGMQTRQKEEQAKMEQLVRERRRAQMKDIVMFGASDERKLAEEAVEGLAAQMRAHNKELEEAIRLSQTIEGVSTRTTDQIAAEAAAVADLTTRLRQLNAELVNRNQLDTLPVTAGPNGLALQRDPGRRVFTPDGRINAPTSLRPLNLPPGYVNESGQFVRYTAGSGGGLGGFLGRNGAGIAAGAGALLGMGLAGNGGFASAAQGALSMGAMGAQIAGPYGAILGATAGFVKGLFDHGKKAREAAEQLKQAQRQFDLGVIARGAAAAGDTARADEVRQQAQFERELAEARKAGMSKSSIAALIAIQAEERLALERNRASEQAEQAAEAERKLGEAREAALRFTEDLLVRGYRTTGQDDLAATASLRFNQRRERSQAVADGASAGDLAFLDLIQGIERRSLDLDISVRTQTEAIRAAADTQIKAIEVQERVAQEALTVQRDQLRAQEQSVQTLRQVVESLGAFSDSLKLGPQTILSPTRQLAEARSQFDTLVALAKGGDVTAAQSLPGAGRTLLDLSRQFYASSPTYVRDFQRVQTEVDAVRARFATQLTVEERILAATQAQITKLEQQITALQAQKAAITEKADEQIAAINAQAKEQRERWTKELEHYITQNNILEQIRDKEPPPPPPVLPPQQPQQPPNNSRNEPGDEAGATNEMQVQTNVIQEVGVQTVNLLTDIASFLEERDRFWGEREL